MFLKRAIYERGIPFEVKEPKPNKELVNAVKEGEKILNDIKKGKRKPYNNPDELFASLDEE